MGKKLISENFKLDDELASLLSRISEQTKFSKSKIIRACLRISLPILEANNDMLKYIAD